MKVLWLASWYPSKIEPYNGDFVQRHAEAASLSHDIAVFHVIKDPHGTVTKNVTVEVGHKGRLTEHIIYYHSRFCGVPVVGKWFSELKYRRLFRQQLKDYLKKNGRPDLVHLHVCLKAGVLALWLNRKYRLPYVVTEHATRFLPEDEKNIHRLSFYHRAVCRKVLKRASAISVVSHCLGKAIQAFSGRGYHVIPNVVNTQIFNQKRGTKGAVCHFLHVSGLGYQKNPEAILAAFALLKRTHSHFVLDIVGPEKKGLQQKVNELGLAAFVNFYPEMPQTALAALMQSADALVLFSRYETFGCVLIEANACGVPVIVNDIPVMRENVSNGFNGLLVRHRVSALADALKQFAEGKVAFDAHAIARHAGENYGYEKVGEAFSQFYRNVLEGGAKQ